LDVSGRRAGWSFENSLTFSKINFNSDLTAPLRYETAQTGEKARKVNGNNLNDQPSDIRNTQGACRGISSSCGEIAVYLLIQQKSSQVDGSLLSLLTVSRSVIPSVQHENKRVQFGQVASLANL